MDWPDPAGYSDNEVIAAGTAVLTDLEGLPEAERGPLLKEWADFLGACRLDCWEGSFLH